MPQMRVKMQLKSEFLLLHEPRKIKVAGGKLNISSATDVVPTDHAWVENEVKNCKVNEQ